MTGWHPLVDVIEPAPGRWELRDAVGALYGRIELRRVHTGELRYRAEFADAHIGWSLTLRTAVDEIYRRFLAGHGPQGGAYTSAER